MKLRVCVTTSLRICACAFDHRRSHVDTNGSALRPNHLSGQEDIKAASGPEIDHDFSWPDVGRGGRISARKAHVGLGRNRSQLFRGIAKRLCNRPYTGVLADRSLSATAPYLALTESNSRSAITPSRTYAVKRLYP